MDYFFYNTDARALTVEPLPRYPVLIQEGFAAVGGDFQQFGEQFDQLNENDILLMYENGVGVVAVGRVREKWDRQQFSEPRYYQPEEMAGLTGGPHEYRIAVEWFLDVSATPVDSAALRDLIGYQPRGAVKRVVQARSEVEQLIGELLAERGLLPGEIDSPKQFTEGAVTQRWVNAYERNPAARDECKKLHGTACIICGFDFGKTFGSDFAGFIHVHHLKLLSEVKKEYQVDPKMDLVPVCPNCHAVLHHGGQLRTPADVRKLLEKAGTPS